MLCERLIQPPANDDPALAPLPSAQRIQDLLFDAARLGRVDVLPALLRAGADIDARDRAGYTPLILASYHGHEHATAMLLATGAQVDRPDAARGNTALMGVAFKGHGGIAARLLAAGAEPNRTNHAGQTALMMAALFGRSAIVDQLLMHGADASSRDIAGNSARSVAEAQGNDVMVARLDRASFGKV
ncbi:ankyrin repeat domain-containing protein [Novosphingobium sp. JCM 18896]|uniref:ankyrin repeat domain-containing protein n=1 Tax=Novosphingobium sp. JCM 18896 TaxID=2989731 RepID=UPI00222293A9|nr:ankyrin repeat domain-containing protein [Novosphingobium sp. JCM 18896]MCW1430286.1 ankyrin repeat domain-containing protein [Novosphingobium sp. JCM 18896]